MFKNNKMEGEGTYTWKSGKIYQGKWLNNQFNGEGTLTSSKGQYKGSVLIINKVLKWQKTWNRYIYLFKW